MKTVTDLTDSNNDANSPSCPGIGRNADGSRKWDIRYYLYAIQCFSVGLGPGYVGALLLCKSVTEHNRKGVTYVTSRLLKTSPLLH